MRMRKKKRVRSFAIVERQHHIDSRVEVGVEHTLHLVIVVAQHEGQQLLQPLLRHHQVLRQLLLRIGLLEVGHALGRHEPPCRRVVVLLDGLQHVGRSVHLRRDPLPRKADLCRVGHCLTERICSQPANQKRHDNVVRNSNQKQEIQSRVRTKR